MTDLPRRASPPFRAALAVLAASLAIWAGGVGTASAATEFGDNCAADESVEGSTKAAASVFALTAVGDPLPLAAPSAGVITRWSVNSALPGPIQQTLKVVRQTGPASVRVIGESTGTVNTGSNTFPTRIPVAAGDHLALFLFANTKAKLLFCKGTVLQNELGIFEGGAEVGSTVSIAEGESEARLPVSAVIEPDVDGDGFGDETQDQCPQSAATQGPCPPPPAPIVPVTLSLSSTPRRSSVTVLVTAGAQATVSVAGTVKLGKGKAATLSGGTQVVAPGTLTKFVLPFPKALLSRLKALGPKASLSLHLSATAPNGAGPITDDSSLVKLKGQARSKHGGNPSRPPGAGHGAARKHPRGGG